jgi:hypothetical protein
MFKRKLHTFNQQCPHQVSKDKDPNWQHLSDEEEHTHSNASTPTKAMRKWYDVRYITASYNTTPAPAATRAAACLLTLIMLAHLLTSASASTEYIQKCSSKKECDYSGCSDLKCASSSPNCKRGTWDFTYYQSGGNGGKSTGDGGSGGRPPLSSSELSKFYVISTM